MSLLSFKRFKSSDILKQPSPERRSRRRREVQSASTTRREKVKSKSRRVERFDPNQKPPVASKNKHHKESSLEKVLREKCQKRIEREESRASVRQTLCQFQ